MINDTLQKDTQQQLKQSKVLSVLLTCKLFQDELYESSSKVDLTSNVLINQSNSLIEKILLSEKVNLSQDLLASYFKIYPHINAVKVAINTYNSRNPNDIVTAETTTIPFRKLIYDGDFKGALDLVELTTASEKYTDFQQSKLYRWTGYFFGSIAGLIGSLHCSLLLFVPKVVAQGKGIYGIYGMIVTYLVNCGFLAGLSFSSKGLENGQLRFEAGTMPYAWFKKVSSLQMCSTIVEADAAINGLEGFATREVIDRVRKMGFSVNEPEQEVMLRQYWVGGGQGFVWCEPDLDPAELLWWKHLEEIGVKKVWDAGHAGIESGREVLTKSDNSTGEEKDDDGDVVLKLV
ncbi:hypothetical protein CANARDRAFT_193348 [[Candida] arabinofermentans NRRL YB-2248]|uniref:Uncharacterized protein n=1 Tax=[Candida] arabinofermentans NRRL YB-2248 TaxID=983967 RepID=A0A1E4T938_9ASCO|nr:hypothetical protein CANARDRAFT_193348 [[Candida] arabinofermentans NRRL YB-2248]